MSSSLPEEVQIAFYRTIKGLEHVEIMRNAYAIEYDCCDPLQLNATLEFRDYPGLYGAGSSTAVPARRSRRAGFCGRCKCCAESLKS